MSDVLFQFLFGSGCIMFGFIAGLSVSWRDHQIGGRTITAPALPRTEQDRANWYVAVGVLAVISTAFAGIQTTRQASAAEAQAAFAENQQQCNAEFRASLVGRAAISAENQQHIDEMISAIAEAISAPAPDSRERVRQAILDYRAWSAQAAQRRTENPIADPACGVAGR